MGIKCPKCHSDNPDNKRFCGECGTQIIPGEDISISNTKTLETPVEEFTRGTTFAGRYEIIEELGKGGMGSVYRVFDKKIEEEVALKLLKLEIAEDKKTIERFRNELKLARKIGHRNVCKMYDLNEEEGINYITMEYVPGEDLKSFIRRAAPLSTGKSVSIAKQVCEGLAEAHRLGVVHRDLKPQNIMIDKDGNAKIMDFGIARSLKTKGITGTGVMIGTPEYMSPEQVEGKKVGPTSDIYSLGVILYEMVTGQLPFKGENPLSIAMKHKGEIPKNPTVIITQCPDNLSQVILKCLEKDKERRFQRAEKLLYELSNIEEDFSTKEKTFTNQKYEIGKIGEVKWQDSIAVLPFTNMSADPEQEYFCDGIAEEIINALSHVESLRVIARTSAFAFKGKHEDVREIGRKLDVETLLEGSVRKDGNRLRITAQLVKVADGSHLWSERFDRNMEDIFAIQDEISLAIVDSLKVKLLGKEKTKLSKHYTNNTEAYNLYLKGLHFTGMLTPEGSKQAIQNFEQSLQRDPNHVLTYSGLSMVYMANAFWANVPPHKAYPKMKEYAEKVLEIDHTIGLAHSILGCFYTHYDWNWKEAEQKFIQALQLDHNFAMTHELYYFFLTVTERHEEAIFEAICAQKLDPLSAFINTHVGHALFNAAQYDEAIEELKSTLIMNPNHHLPHYVLGMAYRGKSMVDEAVEEFERSVELSNEAPWEVMNLACAYYEFGKENRAEKLFNSLKQRSRHEYVPPMCFFYIHMVQGALDQAFEWLKTACEEHDSWLPWCRVNPVDSYRIPDEPRFKALLKKAGLE